MQKMTMYFQAQDILFAIMIFLWKKHANFESPAPLVFVTCFQLYVFIFCHKANV